MSAFGPVYPGSIPGVTSKSVNPARALHKIRQIATQFPAEKKLAQLPARRFQCGIGFVICGLPSREQAFPR
jgi:hypothetical protein